jgi:hypothetical protein
MSHISVAACIAIELNNRHACSSPDQKVQGDDFRDMEIGGRIQSTTIRSRFKKYFTLEF